MFSPGGKRQSTRLPTGNLLLVNATERESRVALVEQSMLAELHVERKRERGIVGNVYKARVLRVLPGMQAAFVDIGQDKAAFLYISDVYNKHLEYRSGVLASSGKEDEEISVPQSRGRRRPTGPIEDRLKEGQEILVQVAKDPIGTKGARVTSHITLPGRHLVHMPTFDHIGVSRRIEDEEERQRLRDLVEEARQPGTGFIVRTASEGLSHEHITLDIEYLTKLWTDILEQQTLQSIRAPELLYGELDLITRTARDLLTDDIDALVIDDFQEWRRVKAFVERFMPAHTESVVLYDKPEAIFGAYNIEIEIERSLDKTVWLKSGGYLVIEQTEALTAVDINTGKFVGKHTLEETILQINLEAAKEIGYQLRLRNIGGLIIIDFIDMEKISHREMVYHAMEEALVKDKAKTNILEISDFGLVEMTRKRVRESLVQTLCEPCYYCEGKGYIKSRQTVAYEILRHAQKEFLLIEGDSLHVITHKDVAQVLYEEERQTIETLELKYQKRLEVKTHPHFHIEQYEFSSR